MTTPGFEVGVFGARGSFDDVTEHTDVTVVSTSGRDEDRVESVDDEERRDA